MFQSHQILSVPNCHIMIKLKNSRLNKMAVSISIKMVENHKNAALLKCWIHRIERRRSELTRKKNNVQLSERGNSVPIVQELFCYHRKLQQFHKCSVLELKS